jgi:hypothetical protein
MAKLILSVVLFFTLLQASSQTAMDFTATDCSGKSHSLFAELNAGKVIVLTWVMPCGVCIPGASVASSTVVGTGNPNVVFYLVDDQGNSSCNTLNSWASTNAISFNESFANTGNAINMADYGTSGMPKTVVFGGANHKVYFNYNGTPSASALQTAISKAVTTGIKVDHFMGMGLNLNPNPVRSTTKIDFDLVKSSEVNIELINQLGQVLSLVNLGKMTAGKHEYDLNLQAFASGIYFVTLNAGEANETVRLALTK